MAPEQALGHAQPASDVFGLAKVVVEMLTGPAVAELLPGAALDLPGRTPEMLRKFALPLSKRICGDASERLAIRPVQPAQRGGPVCPADRPRPRGGHGHFEV